MWAAAFKKCGEKRITGEIMNKCRAEILVVEDDPAIRRGLLDVLVFNGYRADGAADGEEGLAMAVAGSYDLVLLDVMLPSMDGFTICRKLREGNQSQAIVMLTAKGAEDDIVEGFRSGADDYVSKPFSLRELMVRITAVLRRSGRDLKDGELELSGILFSGKTLTATCGRQAIELTRREMDIVFYLNRHRERIVTRKELLIEVWRYKDADIETRTVDIHILKLRKKITELSPGLTLIRTIRGEGYRLEPSEC